MTDPARAMVVAQNVSKTFQMPAERTHTLKERALHPRRGSRHEVFSALRDVSFTVGQGEFFGIVGRNGSGKSTLLKCLAGIYRADTGKIWVKGRMSTFIELGVGFNPDLAAYDNVVTNGIMMGLSPREARDRYEQVIEFAELEEFQDLKLKNYSSGMHVRLAFSVAIQVDAELLLIDEVLAVGDAAFQQKCFNVFNRLRDEGRTIVFVTHDMGAVVRFCSRAMLLEHGDMLLTGDPKEVGDRYLELNFDRAAAQTPDDDDEQMLAAEWSGSHEARIISVWTEDRNGERRDAVRQGDRVRLCAEVEFFAAVEDPRFAVEVEDAWGTKMFVATSAADAERSGSFAAGEKAVFRVDFDNHLGPGEYFPTVSIAQRGSGLDLIHRRRRVIKMTIFGTGAQGGVVDLPHAVTVSRGPEPPG
jgi:ABC-type polysaccharide/polyol phosphate transport system ATPase subunit